MSLSWRRIGYGAGLAVLLVGIGIGAAYALFVVSGGTEAPWRSRVYGGVLHEDSAPPAPAVASLPVDTASPAPTRPAAAAPTVTAAPPIQPPPPAQAEEVAQTRPEPEPAAAPLPAPTPTPQERLLQRGQELAWARRFEAAQAAFDSAVDLGAPTRELVLARARALGWSGDYLRAAEAIAPLARSGQADLELRMEHARYLWWSAQPADADSVLTAILVDHPGATEPRELRTLVRQAMEPSASRAAQWAAEEDTPTHRLWLARALVREGDAAAALPAYRAALREPGAVPTEVILEAAGVALGQDSLAMAASLLDRYLQMHAYGAERADVRLRLARALSWQGRFDEAVVHYDTLLLDTDAPDLRLERARALAWSHRYDAARADVDRILAVQPDNAEALKLLGDVERWDGEPALALAHYRRASASDPGVEGLSEGIRLAREQVAAARPEPREAVQDVTQVAPRWAVAFEVFGDSEDFRWVGASATRRWALSTALALGLSVDQGWSEGPTLLGRQLDSFGLGTSGHLTWTLPSGLAFELQGGLRRYDEIQTFGTWGAGLRWVGLNGARFFAGYDHEPGVRQAGTFASLQAGTEADRVRFGGGLALGPGWSLDGQLEGQRFSTELGNDDRLSGSMVLRRTLAPGLSVAGLVRGIVASDRTPFPTEYGRLYWKPEYYVAPALQLAYQADLAPRWGIGLRATPGYAFVREREANGIRRFGENTATMETGLSLIYAPDGWLFDLGMDWGGAVPAGYQAAALRFQVSSGGR